MKNFNLLAGVTALIAVASFVSYAEYRNTEKFRSLNEKYGELQMKLTAVLITAIAAIAGIAITAVCVKRS